MSYYKACTSFKTKDTIILDNYIDGYHAYWDKYNSIKKEPLEEGMTKYNKQILDTYNQLHKNFRTLMCIQLMLIKFIEEYIPKSQGKIRNIWRIVHAQKGTVSYYDVMIHTLRKYKLKHQNIYNALKNNIAKDEDRLKRNTIFIDETIKECGLSELVDIINEKYNESIYEHTKRFSKEFAISCDNSWITMPEDEYYEKRDNAYIEHIKEIAKENNINLQESLEKAETEAVEHYKEIKETIKADKKNKRIANKETIAKELNMQHNIELFHTLENGNQSDYLSDKAYQNLITALNMMNGKCYYITCVTGKTLNFYSISGKLVTTMAHVAYFASKNDEDALNIIASLKNQKPEAIISIESIAFNQTKLIGNFTKITSKEDMQEARRNKFVQSINDNINNTNLFHDSKLANIQIMCRNANTNKIYFIAAYYQERMYGVKTSEFENEVHFTESLSNMYFTTDKDVIQNKLNHISSDKKATFTIECIELQDTSTLCNKILQQLDDYKLKINSVLNLFNNNAYENLVNQQIIVKLESIYNSTKHITVLARKGFNVQTQLLCYPSEIASQYHKTHNYVPTILAEDINTQSDKFEFTTKLSYKTIISTSEAGDKKLQTLMNLLSLYDNSHIYSMIPIIIDKSSQTPERDAYIKSQYEKLIRKLDKKLNEKELSQEKLTLENQFKDNNDTLYFIYAYSPISYNGFCVNDVGFVKINEDNTIRQARKLNHITFFKTEKECKTAMTHLNCPYISLFIGLHTNKYNYTNIRRIHYLMNVQIKELHKILIKNELDESLSFFNDQESLKQFQTLKENNNDLYVLLRKRNQCKMQFLTTTSQRYLDIKNVNDDYKIKFSSSINKSLIYATTKEDAELLNNYIQNSTNEYVYMITKI